MSSVVTEPQRRAAGSPEYPATVAPRKVRPVVWWAAVGGVAVALQAWVYGSWITSDDFRAVTIGRSEVPGHEKMWAWILQVLFSTAALAAIAFVVRSCVKQRRLSLEAKIMLAWWAVIWLDPAANYFRPQYFFNSYYLNMGSWAEHIPGWISREGSNLPFPFMIDLAFYTTSVLVSVAGAHLMRTVRRRRPQTGAVGLVLVTWGALSLVVFCVEDLLIRAGWLVWNGVPGATVWGHSRMAIPLTEVFVWGATQTALAALFFFKDDRGQVAVERGLDRVMVTGWRKTAISALAIIGFATAAQAVYGIISAPLGFYVGPQVDIPSYMRNGACGDGTPYRCPAPDVPVLLPGSPPGATAEQGG